MRRFARTFAPPVGMSRAVQVDLKMKFSAKILMPMALLPLLLGSCSKSDGAGANAKGKSGKMDAGPARTVRVARAESRPMERALRVVGTLSAHEEAVIAAQVAGTIEKFPVDLGDVVKAGQELALVDTTSYEAFSRQSAANVAKAKAAAANAARNLKRIQSLQQDKIASSSELDQAAADDASASAEVKSVEAAEAIARLNLERSRVKAPFDGAVAQRISTVGGYVAIGAPILRLVKTDPLRLRLDVPEREAIGVKVGQMVRLSLEGDTNVYNGKLSRVAPAIREADLMLPVEADVPQQGALRPGLFTRAQIIISEDDEAVSVPESALIVFAGLEKVVIVKDGKAAEKVVSTGRRSSGYVEIVSGLNAGETVVLEPTGLRTGQPLTIENTVTTSSAGATNRGIGL